MGGLNLPGRCLPLSACEVGHLTEHSRDGPTNPGNSAPPCGRHHRWKRGRILVLPTAGGIWRTGGVCQTDACLSPAGGSRFAPVRCRALPRFILCSARVYLGGTQLLTRLRTVRLVQKIPAQHPAERLQRRRIEARNRSDNPPTCGLGAHRRPGGECLQPKQQRNGCGRRRR